MKKILVATDFSACASNAMEYAMEVAKALKVEVCAIHATGSMEGVNNNIYNAIYIDDYRKNKQEALENWIQTFSSKEEFSGVTVTFVCEVGSFSDVLTKYLSENPVEILVMGTMGATGISGIFGSNVSSMIEKTKVPSLIIPLDSKFSTYPVITLATDFASELSAEDVNALNEMALALSPKEIDVLNVIEGRDLVKNVTGENRLKQLLPNLNLKFNYIQESNPVEGIVRFMISNSTDILCLVKRHHNIIYRIFNRSTVNKVVNRPIKAVLVLHT